MEPQSPNKIKAFFFKIKNKIKERRIKRFLIGFGVVLFVLGVIFLLFPRKEEKPGPTPRPTAEPLDLEVANWSTFSQEDMPVSFKYPPQAQIDVQGNETKLTYWGPSQITGTEYYDAVFLRFYVEDLNNRSLKQVVDERVDEIETSLVGELVSKPTPVKIAGKSGFSFKSKSLGEYVEIYLELNDQEYLRIVDGTQDPNNQGFEEVVKSILSTIETSS